MQVLSIEEVAAKTRLSVSTIYERVRAGSFPKPLLLGERRRGFLEHEVDRWLADLAAKRDEGAKPTESPGRRKYWDDIRAGRRPHPRVVGRLRREAAEASAAEDCD